MVRSHFRCEQRRCFVIQARLSLLKMLKLRRNGECRDDSRGLLELVRLDMQLRKTGKETAERRQVEDAINSVRAKLPEPILGHFYRQK